MIYLQDPDATLYHGDALEVLKTLPGESVHCCVTSPPFYGLRSYGHWQLISLMSGPKAADGGSWDDFMPPRKHVERWTFRLRWRAAERGGITSPNGKTWLGHLGLEPTPELWAQHLVEVFREVRRVLRRDGTLWLEVGDSYANFKGNPGPNSVDPKQPARRGFVQPNNWRGRHGAQGDPATTQTNRDERHETPSSLMGETDDTHISGPLSLPQPDRGAGNGSGCVGAVSPILKPKDLIGAPWLLAFALRADGWYLRSEIIWAKPNPMPENCRDRPTTSHSRIFLLTKSPRYFFDQEAVREPQASPDNAGNPASRSGVSRPEYEPIRPGGPLTRERIPMRNREWNPAGRNIRSVWNIATQPYPEAHFATFPEELARRCIAAGTSERGCCPECGAPWVRIIERDNPSKYAADEDSRDWANTHSKTSNPQSSKSLHRNPGGVYSSAVVKGWRPSCACVLSEGGLSPTTEVATAVEARPSPPSESTPHYRLEYRYGEVTYEGPSPIPCTVLDPFVGSGTVAYVARKLGRRAIGIDLNADYLELAVKRTAQQSVFA